jgi:signal transduction histidine kinase
LETPAQPEADLDFRGREAALAVAVGEAITRGGLLRGVLQRCSETIVENLDAAFARIWTLNEADQVLELQASAGLYTHLDGPHGRVPVGAFKIGMIAEERRPHLTNSVTSDPRVSDKEWARKEGMVAFAGYPLEVDDRLIGVLAMFARRPLSESTISSLGAVADGIALAVERARSDLAREQLVRELTIEKSRLSTIFEHAPAFIATLRGPRHVFEMTNPPYLQLIGHRDILGKTVRDALPEVEGQGFFELLDEVYSSGNPYIGSEVRITLQTMPGSPPEERLLNFVYQPLAGYDGTTSGILVHGVDITEQVRARQRAEEQAVELEAQAEEMERQATQLEEAQTELELASEELQTANTDLLARNEVAEQARSEAERARAEADRANHVKSAFLATMSHELRTPLNAILGYTDLLLAGVPAPIAELAQQKVERIGLSARHLLELIEEILTFSRLEAGEEKVDVEPVEIRGLMAEVQALTEPMALAKAIRYEFVTPLDARVIASDARKLRQILVNLLGNAIKFTDAGAVTLSLADGDGTLRFVVSDSGLGIDPEHLDKVFEPFWQVDDGATRRSGGTGLGLSVTRRLARLLGGEVTVASEVGKGSVFTLELPIS